MDCFPIDEERLKRVRKPFRIYSTLFHQDKTWTLWTDPMEIYFARDPARKKAMFQEVPDSACGIDAYFKIHDGRLVLERITVCDDDDPFNSMLLWHAVFPGLRAPLTCWWMDIQVKLYHYGLRLNWALVVDKGNVLEEGPYEEQEPPEFHEWPLAKKVLLVPVMFLLFPAAMVTVIWQDHRKDKHFPFMRVFLLFPAFMIVFFIELFRPGLIDVKTHWLFRKLRRDAAVSTLLTDALK